MITAQAGDKVKVHYQGTLADGTIFDSSEGRDPLEFTLGTGQVIPGFDAAVIGLSPGQSVVTTIQPDDAYGPANPEMVIEVERDRFPEDMELEEGLELQLSGGGQAFMVRVIAIASDKVTLDGNHPLAGEALTFRIQLESIASKLIL
ncbi:MAG: peptidylprolyl isomerase [Acidobacteriota bacterium]|jgi:peptidylprolyl isomerase|nr:peptidylprolyl isomerase [Bryobacteraceae bacterium CoA2 C42]MCA2964694.1 peptidylprolyl isomerase [Acidobacteriaceae bacterium]